LLLYTDGMGRKSSSTYYQDIPFEPVPKSDRISIKNSQPDECRSCKRIMKIHNSQYHFCVTCSDKYRHFGVSCSHPNCETICDGTLTHHGANLYGEYRTLCRPCWHHWRERDITTWEEYIASRKLEIDRPKVFENTSPTPVENPVNYNQKATCTHCSKNKDIAHTTYQLCKRCYEKLKYIGNNCDICDYKSDGTKPMNYYTSDQEFACGSCRQTIVKYKITHNRLRELRDIKNCQVCDKELEIWGTSYGGVNTHCIDHDHETGNIRGVLCMMCNMIEGQLKHIPLTPEEFGIRLSQYLTENP
jgi:hypothetical protein